MRLIDADALLEALVKANGKFNWLNASFSLDWLYNFIKNTPTVEQKPENYCHNCGDKIV